MNSRIRGLSVDSSGSNSSGGKLRAAVFVQILERANVCPARSWNRRGKQDKARSKSPRESTFRPARLFPRSREDGLSQILPEIHVAFQRTSACYQRAFGRGQVVTRRFRDIVWFQNRPASNRSRRESLDMPGNVQRPANHHELGGVTKLDRAKSDASRVREGLYRRFRLSCCARPSRWLRLPELALISVALLYWRIAL
jgi:hypothetical protein